MNFCASCFHVSNKGVSLSPCDGCYFVTDETGVRSKPKFKLRKEALKGKPSENLKRLQRA